MSRSWKILTSKKYTYTLDIFRYKLYNINPPLMNGHDKVFKYNKIVVDIIHRTCYTNKVGGAELTLMQTASQQNEP